MTAVSVTEALSRLLGAVTPQPSLRLPLTDTPGHVLAEEVVARWPLPPWTASSMDGYAVREADLIAPASGSAPRLALSGGAMAGGPPPPPLAAGTAWRVTTGGRVPEGADTVIRQEDVTVDGATLVVNDTRDAGRNLRPTGGDVALGSVALDRGTRLGAGEIAMLAALGVASPLVVRSPRVAVITSGDEIAPLDQHQAISSGERLADANGPMVTALVQQLGGVADWIGPLPDGADPLAEAVHGAGAADLIVTAGAVSVGPEDHVPDVMTRLGGELLFRRVLMRPGGPTTAAVLPDGRLWIGLPGNPVSARVTFHLFARPVILALRGIDVGTERVHQVRLARAVARHPRLDRYLRARHCDPETGADGTPTVDLTGPQGSWVLSSIVGADGLVLVVAGTGDTARGACLPWLPW